MNQEQWPTDPQWRRFAARIADGCMRARGQTMIVGDGDTGDCCPLGAAVSWCDWPDADTAADTLGIPERWAWDFIASFDKGRRTPNTPASRLGLAYRKLYVTDQTSGE